MKTSQYVVSIDAEIGRSTTDEDVVYIENIECPLMVFNDIKIKRKTFSIEMCRFRVEEKSECTIKCDIAKMIQEQIKKELDPENLDY